ncbi:DUF6069 family protein [Nocardiopsis dassonvillei]|uniref:DUF6069 family protein n=1 Tax=Nocardiopsis dassonvillei TaxID=2014 RepID=UPI00200CC3F8|nr:DUF6069 family protein [Nocardiopsis dassonvillei]MCK9868970.1 DUF6069 family protein [Nocardiopsis dassonvillei]
MTGTPSTTTRPSPALVRAATVLAAGAAALIVWAVADPLWGIALVAEGAPDRPPMRIGAVPTLVVAVGASLVGWALLAVLERFVPRGRVVWTVVAVAVTLLSLVPVLGAQGTAAQLVLAVQHLLVGAIVIAGFTRTAPRPPRATREVG